MNCYNGEITLGCDTPVIDLTIEREGGGTLDYDNLVNKPKINGVELVGNVDGDDLGIREVIDEHTLIRDENGVLKVSTTAEAEEDNTLPITSAGTYVIVGNINSLLSTI